MFPCGRLASAVGSSEDLGVKRGFISFLTQFAKEV